MPFEKFSPPRLNKVYCSRFVLCLACSNVVYFHGRQLATARKLVETARKLVASQEILLWMTPSETKALQASECSELLDPMRASCWISAQH